MARWAVPSERPRKRLSLRPPPSDGAYTPAKRRSAPRQLRRLRHEIVDPRFALVTASVCSRWNWRPRCYQRVVRSAWLDRRPPRQHYPRRRLAVYGGLAASRAPAAASCSCWPAKRGFRPSCRKLSLCPRVRSQPSIEAAAFFESITDQRSTRLMPYIIAKINHAATKVRRYKQR